MQSPWAKHGGGAPTERAVAVPAKRAVGALHRDAVPLPQEGGAAIYAAATASISTSQPTSNSPVTITVSAVCRPPNRRMRTSRFGRAY